MAVITKTIGSTGRDYSTIAGWEADLDNGAVYSASDDAVGALYNDSVFDEEGVSINGGGTIGLSSVFLSPASGERHDGTAGTGVRNVLTANTASTTLVTSTATVAGLEFDGGGYRSSVNTNRIALSLTSGMDASDCIAHDYGDGASALNGQIGYSLTGSGGSQIENCAAYDIKGGTGGGRHTAGFAGDHTGGADVKFYFCTAHNITHVSNAGAWGFKLADAGTNKTVKDCIGTDGETADYNVTSPSSITMDYNLSSDTSAASTNDLSSKSAANQFVSTTGGSEDLHLKSGSDAETAGTPISGITTDIDEDTRDASTPDMGWDEFVAAGGAVVPIFEHHYRMMRAG